MAVPDIKKPAHMTCWHTNIHGGCAVHKDKETDPSLQACRQFKCLWLASQTHPDETKRKPRQERPDITRVVMGYVDRDDDKLIYIQVDPKFPNAWRHPVVLADLQGIVDRGGKVEIIINEKHFKFEG